MNEVKVLWSLSFSSKISRNLTFFVGSSGEGPSVSSVSFCPFMLAKRVIPCLDVDRGRVVKGTNFLNLRDAGDPVSVAARYEQEGADELVFLDITASHEGRDIMLDVVRRTAEQIFMPLTVGGRDSDD
jgi:hypothetical protein